MSKSIQVAVRAIPSLRSISQGCVRSQSFRHFQPTKLRVNSLKPFQPSPYLFRQQSTQASISTEDNTVEPSPSSPAQNGLNLNEPDPNNIDWSRSYHGMSIEPFPKEAADVLMAPIDPQSVEIKPDGIVYLPEIHYRRILNRAFGPGGWGLAPRGEAIVTDKAVTREYALLAHGRLVSIARGEQDYFSKDGVPTATEGCKSNAMVRCCKDLGIASELWDPRFIRDWKSRNSREAFVEHQVSKKRTKIWLRKGDPVQYPYKETKSTTATS